MRRFIGHNVAIVHFIVVLVKRTIDFTRYGFTIIVMDIVMDIPPFMDIKNLTVKTKRILATCLANT